MRCLPLVYLPGADVTSFASTRLAADQNCHSSRLQLSRLQLFRIGSSPSADARLAKSKTRLAVFRPHNASHYQCPPTRVKFFPANALRLLACPPSDILRLTPGARSRYSYAAPVITGIRWLIRKRL